MEKNEFQKLLIEALEELPAQFKDKLQNVDIVIEDNMPKDFSKRGNILLGLYRGIPIKKRSVWHSFTLPDKITIYKNNIEKICRSNEEIKRKIAEVVYHEIGHHFGLSEEELR
ncbi:MAG: metallopeptidase family protein [Candidatus Ratteibacteria bacterium]|nr:metallopeptidase family protein [Candidatus Ratteibacteria bacterium]